MTTLVGSPRMWRMGDGGVCGSAARAACRELRAPTHRRVHADRPPATLNVDGVRAGTASSTARSTQAGAGLGTTSAVRVVAQRGSRPHLDERRTGMPDGTSLDVAQVSPADPVDRLRYASACPGGSGQRRGSASTSEPVAAQRPLPFSRHAGRGCGGHGLRPHRSREPARDRALPQHAAKLREDARPGLHDGTRSSIRTRRACSSRRTAARSSSRRWRSARTAGAHGADGRVVRRCCGMAFAGPAPRTLYCAE